MPWIWDAAQKFIFLTRLQYISDAGTTETTLTKTGLHGEMTSNDGNSGPW